MDKHVGYYLTEHFITKRDTLVPLHIEWIRKVSLEEVHNIRVAVNNIAEGRKTIVVTVCISSMEDTIYLII